VKRNGGIDYALNKAKYYSDKAKEALSVLPDSQSKIALEALVNFVIDRNN
jgi:octaprenyl-diphosphate synthase